MRLVTGSLSLVAVLAFATACAAQAAHHGQGARLRTGVSAPANAAPRAPLNARIVVPSGTVKTGGTLRATLIVENNTCHAIRTSGCDSLFLLEFVSRTYHPAVAWPTCLQRLTLRKGTIRYRIGVPATYMQCGRKASYASPACLPHYKMPPLPPGRYRIVLEQVRHLVPAPAPVPVQVRPAG